MQSRTRHPLPTLILALVLCLSGLAQGHALAGAPAGAMEMVICADGEARSVLVDADGHPVDHEQGCAQDLCPDCVPVKAATLAGAAGPAGQRMARSRAGPCPPFRFRPCRRPQAAQPRGPPNKA